MQIQIIFKPVIVVMSVTHHPFVRIHHDSQDEDDKILEMAGVKKHSANQEVSQKIEDECSFFIPKCHACKDEMQFSEGDTIYGDKWYHNSCWKELEEIRVASH
jgi:hypothetical protein